MMSKWVLLLVVAVLCCLFFSADAVDPVLSNGIVFNKFLPLMINVTAGMGVLMQLRSIKLVSQSRYEALCVYHSKCKGYYLGGSLRRPASEHTNYNRNVAMAYAMHKIIGDLAPNFKNGANAVMLSLGLDPANTTEDVNSPIGVGNYIARKMIAEYHDDGANQLGNVGPKNTVVQWNRMNYSDYTQYEPKNLWYKIKDPDAWQPLVVTAAKDKPAAQTYYGAQFAKMKTFADYSDVKAVRQDDKWEDDHDKYIEKTRFVMDTQVSLTDEQKLLCEYFDNKAFGFRLLGDHIVEKYGNNSLEFHTVFNMLVNTAAGDTFAPIWREKTKFDAARPYTAVRFLYGKKNIQGWGGPGKGIVTMKGTEWQSYLPTDFFSDYPSGTSAFSTAWVQAAKMFLNSNDLDFSLTIPVGGSMIEPGFTPKVPTTLHFPTLDYVGEIGPFTRVLAGVHFAPATVEGARLGKIIGSRTYNKLMDLYAGH